VCDIAERFSCFQTLSIWLACDWLIIASNMEPELEQTLNFQVDKFIQYKSEALSNQTLRQMLS
jgi:hypothetical protein